MVDPKIMHGKPVIKGTRVPVEVILGSLISGMSYEEIEKEYNVKRKDIIAAIEYAARFVIEEELPIEDRSMRFLIDADYRIL